MSGGETTGQSETGQGPGPSGETWGGPLIPDATVPSNVVPGPSGMTLEEAQAAVDAAKPGDMVKIPEVFMDRIAPPDDRPPHSIVANDSIWRDIAPTHIPFCSPVKATPARLVYCFCPALWEGSRPAVVLEANDNGSAEQRITVNVELNGVRDAGVIAQLAKHPQGNTIFNVPLFEPLTEDQRALCQEALNVYPACWCEWMPYQAGQAKKTEAVESGLAARVTELETKLYTIGEGIGSIQETLKQKLAEYPTIIPLEPDSGWSTSNGLVAAIRLLAKHLSCDVSKEIDSLLGIPSEPAPAPAAAAAEPAPVEDPTLPHVAKLAGDKLCYWCPECQCVHAPKVSKEPTNSEDTWEWNGSLTKPTLNRTVVAKDANGNVGCTHAVFQGVLVFPVKETSHPMVPRAKWYAIAQTCFPFRASPDQPESTESVPPPASDSN